MAGAGQLYLMEFGAEVFTLIDLQGSENVRIFEKIHLGLTWSQCEDTFTLHALPTTHCTNLLDSTHCSGAIYHTDMGFDLHSSGGVEEIGGEDFDYAMDCGDFIF